MKCLIIAAGQGKRLRQKSDCKPLLKLLGVPLIERVIRLAMEAGADDFYVVTGYADEKVSSYLNSLSNRLSVPVKTIYNDEWKEKENGVSILKARENLDEPFFLLMSDHIFDSGILKELSTVKIKKDELILAVDNNLNNALIDKDDVTKVKQNSGRIENIGKELTDYNCYDTGIFYASPALFNALEKSSLNGKSTLSDAVKILAEEGRAKAFKINNKFWIDVDDPKALRKAEHELTKQLKEKPTDGPVSRYLNRPVSIRISKLLSRFNIKPNVISLFSFFLSLVAAGIFTLGKSYLSLAIGGVITQLSSVIDGCDGEIARLKFLKSKYGGWFDAVLDRYADAFLLLGLTWNIYSPEKNEHYLLTGFLAIIGSFMLSYTADKYDELMRSKIIESGKRLFRLGRDVRLFLIFLGAVTNQILPALILIALTSNIEVIRRLIVCRDEK